MLETGFVVFLAIALILAKLPRRMLLRVLGHDLAIDVTVTVVTLVIHWGTFSGVMAATVAGLMTSLAWGGVLDFIVNSGDLDCSGFATTAAVYKLLANRARLSGGSIPIIDNQQIDGRPVRHSSAVPTGSMIAGPWPQLLIAAWSGISLLVDPFTNFRASVTSIRIEAFVDIGVRNAATFSIATSIT